MCTTQMLGKTPLQLQKLETWVNQMTHTTSQQFDFGILSVQ